MRKEKKEFRLKIGKFEITTYWGWSGLSFRYETAGYEDGRHQILFFPLFVKFFITLPWGKGDGDCEVPTYGFYTQKNALVLCWNRKNKFLWVPWTWEWVRTSRLLKDNTWAHDTRKTPKSFYKDEWKELVWQEQHPYHYVYYKRNPGDELPEVSRAIATIGVGEMEWRWRIFRKLVIGPKKVSKSIKIDFSDEVGAGRGSWKGGVLGCGYDLREGEEPLLALRRMEKERRFDR